MVINIFELKGVKIESVQNAMLFHDNINKVRNFNVSFSIAIYSLCYSVMKPCNYWNANTLHTVVDNGKKMMIMIYQKLWTSVELKYV